MSALGPIVMIMIRMLHVTVQFAIVIGLLTAGWAVALHSLLETDDSLNMDGTYLLQAYAIALRTGMHDDDDVYTIFSIGAEASIYRTHEWPDDYRSVARTLRTLFRAFLGEFDLDFDGAGV